ncbi:MAG: hypothetical protein KUG78_20855 [Kangiellaceae bacterium]|nr:hypothetical protein [Kangiellaceae bacterium]
MEDVYKSPKSEMTDGEFKPISFGKRIACTIFVLVAVGIYFSVYKIIPQFEEVLSGFGAELPKITSFILSCHSGFIWLAVVSIIPLALWSNNSVKNKYQFFLQVPRYEMF